MAATVGDAVKTCPSQVCCWLVRNDKFTAFLYHQKSCLIALSMPLLVCPLLGKGTRVEMSMTDHLRDFALDIKKYKTVQNSLAL